ncbi:MAG: site-2 protease family protein [Pirellula sp.]
MLDLSPTQHFASSDRPIALRMRPDLIVRERRIGEKTYFIVKDPIRLSHHQLWEEEFRLLQMLDGKATIGSMKEAFRTRYKGSRLDSRRLQILHGQFHRNGLVLSEGSGQADVLQRRNKRSQSLVRWSRFRDWMCIRFRGINPDRVLEYLDQRIGWCFQLPVVIGFTCFIFFSLLFLAGQGASVLSSMPTINEYLNANTVVLLYITFSALKVIHEIGHGMACKHFGGECNEMGLMFLIFTPCLYCDVTDSWMVASKWRRAMIASAGVWFELIAASICMWIWWFSNPGVIHSLCFHAMLVGSVGTLVFNGNPLLKYDAYFVLSDLLDRPNLSQQSKKVVSNGFARFYFRQVPTAIVDYSGRGNRFLWTYGLLSGLYRWVLRFVILLIIYKLFQVFRLEWVGLSIVLCAFAGMFFSISKALEKLLSVPGRLGNLRKGRAAISILTAIALLAALVWLPLPASLNSPVFLEVKDARSVVVLVDGRLLRSQVEGAMVHSGDEIAMLVSKELELSLASRRGELSRQRARLTGLESRRAEDTFVAARIPAVQEAIAGLELEVQRLKSDFEQLTLRAPMDGKILAPLTTKESINPNEVPVWSGTPLDGENIGCVLLRGTTYCQIGNTENFQGIAYLSQGQVELVRPGQTVTIKSKTIPNVSFRGFVAEVGTTSNQELPPEIARSGIVPNRTNNVGRFESTEPLFAARIELAPDSLQGSEMIPLHHSIGTVTIQVDSQSIGTRIARFVYSTFAIDPTVQRKASL